MNQEQLDGEGDPQQQFLEAFKELLEVQNQRMQNGNELLNQYCPPLLFPMILPTQIPNTFIINMGPYYPHIQQPQIYPSQQNQRPSQQQQISNIKEEEPQQEEKQFKGNWLQYRKP